MSQTITQVETKLADAYEVHRSYKTEQRSGWTRVGNKYKTKKEALKAIGEYNQALNLGGLVHIPAEKGTIEFRIVHLTRTVIEEQEITY